MAIDFHQSIELLRTARDKNLYLQLVDQIKKDFERANIGIDLQKKNSTEAQEPEALIEGIHEKLYVLIMEQFEAYINLMYIVDVSEKAMKEIVQTDTVEFAAKATALLVERELQKVELKQNFG